MLPLVLILCGIALLAFGVLEAGFFCFLGALIGMHQDKEMEDAFTEAEAVGYDMSGDRRTESAWDMVMAIVIIFMVGGFIYVTFF